MIPDYERELAEARDAKELYDGMKNALEGFADRLKQAKNQIAAAQRAAKSAEMEKQRAQMKEQNARALANLQQSGNQMNTVVAAITAKADKDRLAAHAASERARLLTPTDIEKDDPLIAAALAEAEGKSTAGTSTADRLAALRRK